MKTREKKAASKPAQKNVRRTGKCVACDSCSGFVPGGVDPSKCVCGHPEGEHEKARQLFSFTITVSLKSGQSVSIRRDDEPYQLQIERDFAGFLSGSSGAPKAGRIEGYPVDGTNRANVVVVFPFAEVSALSVIRKDWGSKH